MHPDPISTWLASVSSFFGRTIIYAFVVLVGSAIPQVAAHESLKVILFGFPLQLLLACTLWGGLCWLAWLAIPALGCYYYRFITEDTQKRDLFIGFSISYLLFFRFAYFEYESAISLLIYAIITFLYWCLPKLLCAVANRSMS